MGRFWVSCVVAALLLGGCQATTGSAPGTAARTVDTTPAMTAPAPELAARLSGRPVVDGVVLDQKALTRFYAERRNVPAWTRTNGAPTPQADALYAGLKDAADEGLSPGDYHVDALAARWKGRDDADWQARDLLLTDALIRYVEHVRVGRVDPRKIDPNWFMSRPRIDPVSVAMAGPGAKDFTAWMKDLAPPHQGYQRLRDQLAELNDALAAGTVTNLPTLPEGDTLELGDRDPRVVLLRQHLKVPAADANGADLMDAAVVQAVKGFQAQAGLKPDGKVGPQTMARLNGAASPRQRAEQIALNMERWRWLPDHLGRRHILVNAGGYRLEAVEDGKVALVSKAVVGRPSRQTPVFRADIEGIMLNPVWHVPPTVLREDILPKMRQDPDYLRRRGYRLVGANGAVDPASVDLSSGSFPYSVQQPAGSGNALGRLKFISPNRHAIFLHDTSKEYLFNRETRTYSSGCVRVERPRELATFVLGNGSGWDRGRLDQAIGTGRTRRVNTDSRIPVYFMYWTAWVDEAGNLQLRPDVYGRDDLLRQALDSRRTRA